MLKPFALLLPALIPSWRFFDWIAPSPRIEFVVLETANDVSEHWQELRPRPAHLSIADMLKRMIWNAHWNESLFLVSCAERLLENPTEHSAQEIVRRIKTEIGKASYVQFRLVLVSRQSEALEKYIAFTSPVYS